MTVLVIAQARMGSSRLPGKVLMPLGGLPAAVQTLSRARMMQRADRVVLATSDLPGDDPLAEAASAAGFDVFRGSEDDVLGRFQGAAAKFGADVIVRLTCDCPLFDPAVGDALIDLLRESGAEYASNVSPVGYPHGLDCEAFTRAALDRAATEALDPREREHVTPFIRERDGFSRVNLDGPGGQALLQRWVLDYPEDYEMLAALFPHLPQDRFDLGWREVLDVVSTLPGIAALNADKIDMPRRTLAGGNG